MAWTLQQGIQTEAFRASHRTRPYLLLLVYLLLVALAQSWISPAIELDQAEQAVLAQRLQWGYTNQPPLYTWLVWAAAQVSGHWVSAVWAIKIGLLMTLVVACDGVALELGLSTAQRRVAAAGLALLPAVVWEAQRDLTHSLLSAAMCAGVLWSVLSSLNRPAWWRDVRSGVLVGAALLAKQNAVLFLASVPVALCLVPEVRRQIRWGSLLIVAVVGALVWLPHGLWLWQHPHALARTVEKIHQGDVDALEMWTRVTLALLSFLLPWLLLAVPLFWRQRQALLAGRLLGRLAVVVMLVMLGLVGALGIDNFNPRWLLTLLFFLPLWLAASIHPQAGPWGRRLVIAGGVTALVVAAALPGRIALQAVKATRQNIPYRDLSNALLQSWGSRPPVLLATNHLDGGNLLAMLDHDVRVLTPIVSAPGPDLPQQVTIVARERDLAQPTVRQWLKRMTGLEAEQIQWQGQVAAPMLYRPQAPLVHLSWARVPLVASE